MFVKNAWDILTGAGEREPRWQTVRSIRGHPEKGDSGWSRHSDDVVKEDPAVRLMMSHPLVESEKPALFPQT